MIQIAQVPYRKTYKFPLLSDSMALMVITYGLVILASFFMYISFNSNFYLSSVDSITINPSLKFAYQYHLTIETSDSIYVYSDLFEYWSTKALSFQYLQDQKHLAHYFNIKWQKPVSEAVRKASLLVFMKYTTEEVTDAMGMVLAQGEGVNIADLNIAGFTHIKEGMDPATIPPTASSILSIIIVLADNEQNIQKTLIALERDYSTYLGFTTTKIVNNMPNNQFKFSFVLKTETHSYRAADPTILGQLIWSWGQFFPVVLVLWLIATWTLGFCFRQNLLNRSVQHQGRIFF